MYILNEDEYRDLVNKASKYFQEKWELSLEVGNLKCKVEDLEKELQKWKDV
jgi:chromosome segregation ATPase